MRIKNVPLLVPLLPVAMILSDAVLTVLNYRMLRRLQTRVTKPR